jgi:hypothetical protein
MRDPLLRETQDSSSVALGLTVCEQVIGEEHRGVLRLFSSAAVVPDESETAEIR